MVGITMSQLRFNVQRSRFVPQVERKILNSGGSIPSNGLSFEFDEQGGYGSWNGAVVVEIVEDDREQFGTDWHQADPSRFPARIKAAATALRNCECFGVFVITHNNGAMTIRPR